MKNRTYQREPVNKEDIRNVHGSNASRSSPFVDLVALWQSGVKPEKPTVVKVSESRCLFYAGRLNEIHSEPSLGKTNIAIYSALKVLENGGSVIYMDPEDTASGFLRRLLALGLEATPLLIEETLRRVHYIHDPDEQTIKEALGFAKTHKCQLAVYDGLAEGMAAEDLDEDKARDTLKFLRRRLRPFAELGCAVVILDHVVKSKSGQGRWSRGSGAKLGRYDGVSYVLQSVKPYTPKIAGKISLRVAKDRHGGVGATNQKIGDFGFMPNGDGTTEMEFIEIIEPPFKPTALMKKVHDYITANPDASKSDLRALGKAEWVDKAIDLLITEGYLSVNKGGIGRKNSYFVLKKYQ